mgnify:CR=1 FL=1
MLPQRLSVHAERALRSIAESSAQINPDFAVFRVSSIVEVYVDELLESTVARYFGDATPFERSVADHIDTQMRQSWSERRKWLKSSLGVDLSGQAVEQEMQIVIDLRNAIAHGGGRVTHLQKKVLQKQLSLQRDFEAKLGAFCDGDRVTCTDATLRLASKIATRYVHAIEEGIEQAKPGANSEPD